MKLKPYLKYKDSGGEWLGKVPEHWTAVRLKHVAEFRYGDSLAADDRVDGHVPVFGSNGKVGTHTFPNTLSPAIIIGRKGSFGRVAFSTDAAFAIDTTYFVDQRCSNFNLRWLYYALQTLKLDEFSQDTGVPGLSREDAYQRMLAAPRTDEQTAIAAFLDRETAKIDALIVKQEKLIELLKEKRQAVISHAVTKGLDSTVTLKPSGVGWLGDVPEHWDVSPVRHVARLESGHTPSRQHPEYWENCTIPWFSLADVWQIRDGEREYISETKELVSELGLANSSARLLPKGTVVLSRTASVGYSAIMAQDMATTQDFANWVCGSRLLPEYLLYIFRSMKSEFRRLTMGSTHQTIYMPDISAFRCSLPPLDEQREIVQKIREAVQKIDRLIARSEAAMELERERRSALISSAVTGKIDVRRAIAERLEAAA